MCLNVKLDVEAQRLTFDYRYPKIDPRQHDLGLLRHQDSFTSLNGAHSHTISRIIAGTSDNTREILFINKQ